MMLCEPRPLNLKPYQDEYRRNLRRYRRAIQKGKWDRVHQLENLLLKSHSAKICALAKAAKKKNYPLYPAKLEMMAGMLSCWEDPIAPATLYFKKKSDGGRRPIFSYRVMRLAQQYLVVEVLAPRLRLHDGQYAVPGRDRTDAIEKSKQLIREGYHWVIRGDIKNCHSSMNGEKVLAGLPGPTAVLRQVVLPPLAESLNYSPGDAIMVEKARWGFPQGAASTPLVAAAALAPVLDELPDDAVVILYVDDFAIFTTSKAAAANARNTLQLALAAAPIGDLQLKFCNIHHVTEGFGFLGYHILSDGHGSVLARPRLAALQNLERQLDAVDAGVFSNPHKEKMARLRSWRCSYASWEGDELGDASLIAILGHHFSGDLEDFVRLMHLRAKEVRERRKAALT